MDQCNLDLDMMNDNSDNCDNILDNLTDDLQLMGEEAAYDMGVLSHGIDFTQEDQLDLDNILIANPMLGGFSQGLSSSQTKYFDEEPMLADENSSDTTYNQCSQNSLGFGLGQVEATTTNDVQVGLAVHEAHPATMCGVNLKRTASMAGLVPKVNSMPPKRNKLILNINRSLNTQSETMNTPDIIEQVLNFDEVSTASRSTYQSRIHINHLLLYPQQNSGNISTQDIIYKELLNTDENTASTSYAELSPPNTPYSAYSVSTSHSHSYAPTPSQLTAPVSPAFSNASTSQFSATTSTSASGSKRKRGRPAKEHSDGPDPELMSRLKPEELKLYCDRMKNNEASRISRRKTKKREDEEKQEEEILLEENVRLTTSLNKVLNRKKRHEDYLKQWHHRHSTYVKPEPEH